MKQSTKGFTLVELMIVIAIIGILAAVGYPAYTDSVKKGNRADGVRGLLTLAGRMEEYYMNNDSYKDADVATLLGSNQSADGRYTISFDGTPDAFQYKLKAVPNGTDAECTSLTLSSLGVKDSSPAGSVCW